MSDWFIFSGYFPIGGLISLWSRGFTIFQSNTPKRLLSNSKAVNTCEVHIISHGSAVRSKKKMVAGKSYYRY